MTVDIHPEVRRLRDECEQLVIQHGELVAEADMLRHNTIPTLTARYMMTVGVLELELLGLQCEVQRRRRLFEMINASLSKGEKPCLEVLERQLDAELAAWYEKLRETERAVNAARARQRASEGPVSGADRRELKRLYRAMVRKLHPDLHPQHGERELALWHRLQDAYTRCDLEALRVFALLVDEHCGAAEDAWVRGSIDVLRDQRDRLSKSVMALIEEIAAMRSTFPCDHRDRLENPVWVAEKIEAVRAAIEAHEKRLEHLANLLTAIVGEGWKGGGPMRNVKTIWSDPTVPRGDAW